MHYYINKKLNFKNAKIFHAHFTWFGGILHNQKMQVFLQVEGRSTMNTVPRDQSIEDEQLDRPKQKAVVLMLNPKKYATHAWHDSIVV